MRRVACRYIALLVTTSVCAELAVTVNVLKSVFGYGQNAMSPATDSSP